MSPFVSDYEAPKRGCFLCKDVELAVSLAAAMTVLPRKNRVVRAVVSLIV